MARRLPLASGLYASTTKYPTLAFAWLEKTRRFSWVEGIRSREVFWYTVRGAEVLAPIQARSSFSHDCFAQSQGALDDGTCCRITKASPKAKIVLVSSCQFSSVLGINFPLLAHGS